MTRKIGAVAAIVVIVVFIVFMIYDSISQKTFTDKPVDDEIYPGEVIAPVWETSSTYDFTEGQLNAIAMTPEGKIVAGGRGFLSMLTSEMDEEWMVSTESEITAIYSDGAMIYAACGDIIKLFNMSGEEVAEWGPYEERSIITSISGNSNYIAFADAGMKRAYILSRTGELVKFFGHEGEKFVIPSPYFDLHITANNTIYITNPGKTRIETRDIDGTILAMFGEPGTAPAAYCGCCNPSHFATTPEGNFVTSEKGINRIKIMSSDGTLIEFVTVQEQYESTQPLDLAVGNDGFIYGASSYDSKIYKFKRR